MAKKCFLDDGHPAAGYTINELGDKIHLCILHLIPMSQKGMEIKMMRGRPPLPEVDPKSAHDWKRATLVGDNVWKCSSCELEIKQMFCPPSRAHGGCAGTRIDWQSYGMPINLKWRT